jgi:lipoprotein-anchoring transpeptidase ErfK/SrfK
MQRTSLGFAVILSTVLMCSPAMAGPLSLEPTAARAGMPALRPAAAQGDYGGGFLEFLFRGGVQQGGGQYDTARAATPGTYYHQYPADLGPSMVESPMQPGSLVMDPRYVRQEVSYNGDEGLGTIIINTRERLLYLVQSGGRALRYGIGVGRPGFTWSGVHHISQKREWPDWTPPEEMLRRRPDLPRHMQGGPDNPLGARALYLGSTLYRIHGSNEPWTIGTQVSSGCIRMRNEDVIDLYGRVKIGTKVIVI